ncbi:MAG: hypothetical protein LIO95_11650 [Clostridiales bacterium]|nr:hypothetical protein [Clostridiales bacterium]
MKNVCKILGVSLGIAALMLGVIRLCFRLQGLFHTVVTGDEEEEDACWPV